MGVNPGSPAHYADLRPGMVIVEAGGKPIKRAADLRRVLSSAKSGPTVLLCVEVGEGKLLRALTVPE